MSVAQIAMFVGGLVIGFCMERYSGLPAHIRLPCIVVLGGMWGVVSRAVLG